MPDLPDAFGDADSQDGAEAFDEDNLDPDALRGEMRTFEELDDVEDLTQADGDRDDDEAVALDADEFDEDAFGDADAEEDHELDLHAATDEREDDLDGQGPEDGFDEDRVASGSIEGLDSVADADSVEGGEDDVSSFQSKRLSDADLVALGYGDKSTKDKNPEPETPSRGTGATPDDIEDNRDPHTEKNLDDGVEETFPASDPVSISPGAD